MKKIFGIGGVVAVIFVGAYYGLGVATQQSLEKNIAILDQSNGIDVEIKSYHRGFFTSHANLEWVFHIPEHSTTYPDGVVHTMAATDITLPMDLAVYHGPIIFSKVGIKWGVGYADTSLKLPAQYQPFFEKNFTKDSTEPSVGLSFYMPFFNSCSMRVNIPKFKLVAKKEAGAFAFSWLGMVSNTTITQLGNHIEGSVVLDTMQFKNPAMDAKIGNITNEFHLEKSAPYDLFTGNAMFSLPYMVVNQEGKKAFELNELDARTDSTIQNELLEVHFQTSVEKIFANGLDYGPGRLNIGLRNIDAQVLAHINKELEKIKQHVGTANQMTLLALVPEFPKLFAKGAEFEVDDFRFTLPEGRVEASMVLQAPKDPNINPFQWLQHLKGDFKLKVPKQIALQLFTRIAEQSALIAREHNAQEDQTSVVITPVLTAREKIRQWVDAGMLIEVGDDYTLEAILDESKFSVNNKPWNPKLMVF